MLKFSAPKLLAPFLASFFAPAALVFSLFAITTTSLVGLTGCSASQIPVENRTSHITDLPRTYKVRRGDTLYMIAMEFDLDYRKLGKWNKLKRPYRLHRSQVLKLHPPGGKAKRNIAMMDDREAINGIYTVRRGDTLGEIANSFHVMMTQLVDWNRLRAPYAIHPGQKLRVVQPNRYQASQPQTRVASKPITRQPQSRKQQDSTQQNRQIKPTNQPKTTRQATRNTQIASSSGKWQRPTTGKITGRFSAQSDGLTFSGSKGDPVYAAADGEVVYSGTGLVRYGKLLIVHHENDLLSAYAHNDALLVKEGDAVKVGQQIAKMGNSGTDSVKLHFEIRKDGQPVDPLKYLK